MQITILGCSFSLGVPVIGCNCLVCQSSSSYNKRTRSAIIISDNDSKILVDFGTDIRNQLLRENISYLDAAILTHEHADHVAGIDDLRVFVSIHKQLPLNIYLAKDIEYIIREQNKYLLQRKQIMLKPVDNYQLIKIKNITLQLFSQIHGNINSLGIRVGDFVYSSDVSDFPAESLKYLKGIKTWILDYRGEKSNYSHAGLDKILLWDKKFKPEKIFLTSLDHNIDYHQIVDSLPPHIQPLYDGLIIKL